MNRHPTIIVILMVATITLSAEVVLRTFDQEKAGAAPGGFTFTMTRQVKPAVWLVRADGNGQYLTHLADATSTGGLSIATLSSVSIGDVRASVRVRLTGGERVGGVVWRYKDSENFYAVALDLRAQEIALFRIMRGNRIRLEDEGELELDPDAWHSIRVEHQGERIRVSLGGIGVIGARDRALPAAGEVGVWSGGGSASGFDDLRVEENEERRRASADR